VARLEESIGRSIRLYKQITLASINEHYSKAPEKFSFCEGLDRGPKFRTSSKRLKREVGIRVVVSGYEKPQKTGTGYTYDACPESKYSKVSTRTTFLIYKSDTVNELPVHNFIFQHSRRHCPNIY
jgi:hypothetical protein